jgi:hypothetical protein
MVKIEGVERRPPRTAPLEQRHFIAAEPFGHRRSPPSRIREFRRGFLKAHNLRPELFPPCGDRYDGPRHGRDGEAAHECRRAGRPSVARSHDCIHSSAVSLGVHARYLMGAIACHVTHPYRQTRLKGLRSGICTVALSIAPATTGLRGAQGRPGRGCMTPHPQSADKSHNMACCTLFVPRSGLKSLVKLS